MIALLLQLGIYVQIFHNNCQIYLFINNSETIPFKTVKVCRFYVLGAEELAFLLLLL